jgi:hypothetical protein
VHACNGSQLAQSTPPVPQTLVEVPVTHVPEAQQPSGHVDALHSHSLSTQP